MQDNSLPQQTQTLAQKRFYASEQCATARRALERMVEDQHYDTDSLYYRQNALDFIERHLHYMSTHLIVNVEGYISNLKLMTRKRT
ncbi:MAG TPA: hypothetical protein VLF40_04995 [Candidatus Saccharimonadales bacterium]|nr:hypothetical protein [Candidatus Saccharimonadales bacterium]